MADRYQYVEFSQPYLESRLVMVVTEKPENSKWFFMKVFKKEMWVTLAVMSVFVGFVIWLIERAENPDFDDHLGTMLWFSFTVLFFVQSKFYFFLNHLNFDIPFLQIISSTYFLHIISTDHFKCVLSFVEMHKMLYLNV